MSHHPLNAQAYIFEKMHHDQRRKMVISGLIDNRFNQQLSPQENQTLLSAQFKDAVSILYTHIDDLDMLTNTIQILNGANLPLEEMHQEKLFLLLQFAREHTLNLYHDAHLLVHQARALLPDNEECQQIKQDLTLILCIGEAHLYLHPSQTLSQRQEQEARICSMNKFIVKLEHINSSSKASAFSALLATRYSILMCRAQKDTRLKLSILNEAQEVLEHYIALRSRLPLTAQQMIHSSSFLCDLYLRLLRECSTKAELQCLEGANLKQKLLSLPKSDGNQKIYEFLFNINELLTLKGSLMTQCKDFITYKFNKKTLADFLNVCEKRLVHQYTTPLEVSTITLGLFLWMSEKTADHFTNYGSEKEKKRSKLLSIRLREHYSKLLTQTTCFLNGIASHTLRYQNADLKRDMSIPEINYPDEGTLAIQMFQIACDIEQSKTRTDVESIHCILNQACARIAALTIEFDDVYPQWRNVQNTYQTRLFTAENNALLLLQILLARKKNTLGIPLTTEEQHLPSNGLTLLYELVVSVDDKIALYAQGLNYYIVLCAAIIHFIDQPYAIGQQQNFIKEAQDLFVLLYNFHHKARTEFRYQDDVVISPNTFNDLTEGFGAGLVPDLIPQSTAQQFIYQLVKQFIDKLLEMRSQLEVHVYAELNNADNAYAFMSMNHQISALDAILHGLNLMGHQGYQQKYTLYLKSHRLTEQHLESDCHLSSRRSFVLSSLISFKSNKMDLMARQYKLAGNLLLIHTLHCVQGFAALHKLSNQKEETYSELQSILKDQLGYVCADANLLATQSKTLTGSSPEFNMILVSLIISYRTARAFLETVAKSEPIPDLFNDLDVFSLAFGNIINEDTSEAFFKIIQVDFDARLKQCATPDLRKREFTAFVKSITRFIMMLSTATSSTRQVQAIRAQFITDIYLHGYSLCEDNQEAGLFDNECHKLVFGLILAAYNSNARDFIYQLLKQSSTNGMGSFDIAFKMELHKLLTHYFKAHDLLKQILAKASIEQRTLLQPINMNSTLYHFFVDKAEELIHSLKNDSAINTSHFAEEQERLKRKLEAMTELFNPQTLLYRPMLMNERQDVCASFEIKTEQRVTHHAIPLTDNNPPIKTCVNFEPKETVPPIDLSAVAELMQHDPRAMSAHYLAILNSPSRQLQQNPLLRIKVLRNLAETLPLIADEQLRQHTLRELEYHAGPLIKKSIQEDTLDVAFEGNYSRYLELINRYKPAEPLETESRQKTVLGAPAIKPVPASPPKESISTSRELFLLSHITYVRSRPNRPRRVSCITTNHTCLRIWRYLAISAKKFSSKYFDLLQTNIV